MLEDLPLADDGGQEERSPPSKNVWAAYKKCHKPAGPPFRTMTPACQNEVHCYKILLLQCQVFIVVMVDTEVKIPLSKYGLTAYN